MRSFSMLKKTMTFMIFNDFNNFMVLGPRPLGPMGPSMFRDFLKMCFMVWDLSRSVRMVFRSPGNTLIKLFHFIFNSKCNFSKVSFFIQLPIELPIVLPIELPIEFPYYVEYRPPISAVVPRI